MMVAEGSGPSAELGEIIAPGERWQARSCLAIRFWCTEAGAAFSYYESRG